MKLDFFSIHMDASPLAGPRTATVEFMVHTESDKVPWVTYKVEFIPDDPNNDDLPERLKKQALEIVKSYHQYLQRP